MAMTINLRRFPETITYLTEDMKRLDGGWYTCPGTGDETGAEYKLTFDQFRNLAMVEKV